MWAVCFGRISMALDLTIKIYYQACKAREGHGLFSKVDAYNLNFT